MADTYARISGRILNVSERSGTNDRGPWAFTQADVFVANRGVTTVSIDKDLIRPRVGDDVDYLIRVGTNKYGARIDAVADYPVLIDADSFGS